MSRGHFAADMTGQRFGRLMVLQRAPTRIRKARWDCVCDCGVRTTVFGASLRRGLTTSCGCRKAEALERLQFKTRHGATDSPAHRSWMSMRQRCLNSKNPAFHNYGGRGITICDRWSSFENFLADMGQPPDGMEIERNNVNGNYEPGNCRWATPQEQANNKRATVRVTHEGRTQTIKQWACELGIKYHTLYRRIVIACWPTERAMK
jgi:hypothetical protein